ncbi:hypothetical protein HRbin41_00374 [bacterium HR41]|nr:hypothetical protein HRbin41_00374 [bacterium HR41]
MGQWPIIGCAALLEPPPDSPGPYQRPRQVRNRLLSALWVFTIARAICFDRSSGPRF